MFRLKRTLKIISTAIVTVFLVCLLAMSLYPEKASELIGFRFYTVLTNSMEPKIPTNALVFSKNIDEAYELKPDTIVTFQAERFGEDIFLTHYFRKTQEKDGVTYYRTQGATATAYDEYETKRSDIVGVYLFHIPYLGKIFLFLKSPFGYVMYGELAVIFLINKVVRARWDEKERASDVTEDAQTKQNRQLCEQLVIHNVQVVIGMDDTLYLKGEVTNTFAHPIHFIAAKLSFYDQAKQLQKEEKWYLCGREYLLPKETKEFCYILVDADAIAHYDMKVISYKE